jgi:hypothetical protein
MKFNADKNIEISIFHMESRDVLLLDYPEKTRNLWQLTAMETRFFINDQNVVGTFQKTLPTVIAEWVIAQKAFERLAAKNTPHNRHLTLEEAHRCLDLFSALGLHKNVTGRRWEFTMPILLTLAEMVPCLVSLPHMPLVKNAWGKDPAVECYETYCVALRSGPLWFTTYNLFMHWLILAKYQGTELGVLTLRDELRRHTDGLRQALQGILMPDI